MFKELTKLRSIILECVIIFLVTAIFFFFFSFKAFVVFDVSIPFPVISSNSLAVTVFHAIESYLLPGNVILIATGPLSALNAETLIAALIGLFVTFPFFINKCIRYLLPALLPREQKIALLLTVSASLLFFIGIAFSYIYVMPPAFSFLFGYATNIGIVPMFSVEDFIATTFLFVITSGCMFLLPVFMVLLSFVGIISTSFWKTNWRYAQFFFLAFSAIITPDGSGVSMVLLTLPFIGLYVLGIIISNMVSMKTKN